jgi:hypothetical protein
MPGLVAIITSAAFSAHCSGWARKAEKKAQEAPGVTISPGDVGQAIPEGDRPPQGVAAAREDGQD